MSQLQTFPNHCPDFKWQSDAAKSKGRRRVQSAPEREHDRDASLAPLSPVSSEPGQARVRDEPAGGFHCSKSHTGRPGPQTVSSDSSTMDGSTWAKKDFSPVFISLVL